MQQQLSKWVNLVAMWSKPQPYLNFQMYAMHLAQKAKELKREKRKSDSLLFQMLPPSVAMQLKQTHQVKSVYHFISKNLTNMFNQIL